MRLPVMIMATICAGSPAFASGGAYCESEGGAAKVVIEAGITRGMGGPVFSLNASAEIGAKTVAEDLRSSRFAKGQLAQYWLDGEDLRFLLYRDRERAGKGDFGSVELTVAAKTAGDGSSYAGTYVISVFEGGQQVKFEGRISCSVE